MAAGVTTKLWSWTDMLRVIEDCNVSLARIAQRTVYPVERGGLVAVPGGLVLVKANCRLEPLQQAFHLRPGH